MATAVLPIANGSYTSRSLPVSAQQCINWFPQVPDAPALANELLFGTPGFYQVATNGPTFISACRGSHEMAGLAYFVNGENLFRLNADHTSTNLGTIAGQGSVSMADNGTQLMIVVPEGSAYIFTEPSTLTTITASGLRANGDPTQVVFIDGFFVCTTDENKFICSSLRDGLVWSALDFGSAESSPDGVVVPIVYRNQLFVGGTRTMESFQNIGGADFPFQRSGLFIDKGVSAAFSAVSTIDSFMFIGAGENEEPGIFMFSDNSAKKVSTQAIDDVLQQLSETELVAITSWFYGQGGHYFVGFSLPETTLVYDVTTSRWADRKSRIVNALGNFEEIPQRARHYVSAYGRTYVGDSQDGRIGVVDLGTFTEYGALIKRSVTLQPFQNNMESFTVPSIEATVESGVGNTAAPNPQIMMETSKDGGKTWSDPRSRDIGAIGQYKNRSIWRRNGRFARFIVMRFSVTDPIKPVFIQLTAEMQ